MPYWKKIIFQLLFIYISLSEILAECPANCFCQPSSNFYRITCDQTNNFENIKFIPDKFVQIECNAKTKIDDYLNLPPLNFPSVEVVRFYRCPFDNTVVFRDLFNQMHITNVSSIRYQNYDDFLIGFIDTKQLQNLQSVTRLELTGMRLNYLPIDVFLDLPNLKLLDLKANNLTLPAGIFKATPELESLELAQNGILNLSRNLFIGLSKLQRLNLWGNNINIIDEDAFEELHSLQELDLSHNKIESLSTMLFNHSKSLKRIDLQNNFIENLQYDLFVNNEELESLNLSHNNFTQFPAALFANLTKLKIIKADNCRLKYLPADLIMGSTEITNISLQRNVINELPSGIFKDTIKLLDLNLGYNNISVLPSKIFSAPNSLQKLRLNDNNLISLSNDVFENLRKLLILDLSNNKLHSIHHTTFAMLPKLEELNLNNNYLSFENRKRNALFGVFFSPSSPLSMLSNLRKLHLSNNSFERIYSDWSMFTLLTYIDLSHNSISYIEAQSINFISRGVLIDISYNNISEINLESAELIAEGRENSTSAPNKILIGGNPIICDCNAFELIRFTDHQMTPQVYKVFDINPGDLTCISPSSYAGQKIREIHAIDFTCPFEDHTKTCPDKCICILHALNNTLIVNCSNQQLIAPPPILPNHQRIVLDLSNNSLESLQLKFGNTSSYQNVAELYVPRNNISTLNFISFPRSLERLELHANNLREIDTTFLSNISTLQNLTLHENPWICDCSTLNFLGFLQTQNTKISYISNITCDKDQRALYQLSKDDLCPLPIYAIVLLSASIMIVFTLMALTIVYYRHKTAINVWLFAHKLCLCVVREEDLDENKEFDAFISYSQKDEQFVVKQLVPNLELGNPKFKLCLHYRDWIGGEMIPNQIAHSVEQSRRTVIVLSPNFLKSVWGIMEFRTAHLNALQERRARVIILKIGDIGPYDQLEPELRAYLSMNTYIDWDERNFWDRLRYALPHKRELSKNGKYLSNLIVKSLECQTISKSIGKAEMV